MSVTSDDDSRAADLDARADALFAEALDLPEEDRAWLITSRTLSDPALRAAVEQLLQLAAAPAPAFDAVIEADASRHARARFAPGQSSDAIATATEPADGQRIGAWQVMRRIGHGGMGTVFLVERADGQYEQRGALKLVHAHAADVEAHQRFARERRILASLDHAHVARLLDGGQTEDGRLYFVMEYVEGRPIDRFCDETRATIDRRLQLFQQVCAGVQHAHDRLVVHRDLKPSNILVTDAGDVKLLDFGIARLLSADTSAPATRLLTPEYASPEQWRGEPVAIASDVYQLGLLLYEMLTGQPAQTRSSGASDTPQSFERIVCDTVPTQPSTRVKAGDPAIATARRVSRSALARALSGDLDNITLFALRKEPGRRYASVRDLSDDVRRHRLGRPVRARGDAVLYRAGKFIGRHRIAVAVATIALTAVTIAMVLTAGERWRAAREAAYAERVEDMLDRGRFDAAEASFRESLALFRTVLPARNAQVPLTEIYRSRLLIMRGRPDDLVSADALLITSLAMLRRLFEDEHPLTALALKELGYLRTEQGRYAEAEARLKEAQVVIERWLGAKHPQAPRARVHQAELARRQGRDAEAIALAERALDEFNALGLTDHPAAIDARLALGNALLSQRRTSEALATLRDGLSRAERQFVEGDARTARFRSLLPGLR